MMQKIEEVFLSENPDAVLVYGDTNSTLAGSLVASKMNIPSIHIEAGLRSYNRTMPEEVNRIIADEFSKMLFCPTQQAIENLKKEGIKHEHIYHTGDVMCDMLYLILPKVKRLVNEPYYFATTHRPYNTDEAKRLIQVLETLQMLDKQVIFPIHPRTVSRMNHFGLEKNMYSNIIFIEPVGYVESISYQCFADCIITDSGGMQKETYMLRKNVLRCEVKRNG